MLFFLLFVVVLILDNLFLLLDIDAFFTILDNRLRFFNNNIRTIMFTRDVKTITSNTIIIASKYFVLYFIVVNKICKIV